jgi:hypothetical protein
MGTIGTEVALAGLVLMTLIAIVWDIRQAKRTPRTPRFDLFPAEVMRERSLVILAIFVALSAGVAGRIGEEPFFRLSYPLWGVLVGVVTVGLARAGERCWSGGENPLTPWLLGFMGAGFAGLIAPALQGVSAFLGGIVGALLSAGLSAFDKERRGLWGWESAWVYGVGALALSLARLRGEETLETAVLLLVLVVVVSAIGLQWSSSAGASLRDFRVSRMGFPSYGILVYYVIFGVGVWLLGRAYLDEGAWASLVIGGSLLVFLCGWLVSDNSRGTGRLFLVSLLWVLLATVSFGMLRGYGMGVALLSGVLTAQAMGYRGVLPALGLACGLVVFRLFMSLYGGEFTTLEIGQHYVFVGVLMGALLPVTLWEVGEHLRGGLPPLWAGMMVLLMGLIVSAGMLLLPLFTGVRGGLGLIAGLALAPLLQVRQRDGVKESGVVLPLALGALFTVGYEYVKRAEVWEREEKIRWAVGIGVGLLVVVLVGSWLVSRVWSEAREGGETA